ncbi:hypothetical protein [Roseiterribacter gracilis]|uniref:AAA+ ATPase domain-containing protein n=1 Tax=Roseiterribacter gracilis TaxID=2812848 RepID=A0A8S8XBL6_9PROT|nr:hypothetical protein TMPK1_12560 [Rhodospirillales bacterium TMPK1]
MSRIHAAAARDPFRPRAATSAPFPSLAFERARADATASLARGVSRVAITGPAGVGKSALLTQLARDVAAAGDIAWLRPPAMIAPNAATLLVDEIDHLDATTRASLLARAHGTRMLVAGIEDPDPTDDTVTVQLAPLEPEEVRPYVEHRLRTAGLDLDLFDDDAIRRIGTAASRIPRVIDVLAGRALFAARLDEADTVTAIHARQAIEEHASLLAAASSHVEPALVDAALALAADEHHDVEPARPLVAERIWSDPVPRERTRLGMPVMATVAVGCFILGAALVLAARASDAAISAPLAMAPPSPAPTEASAYTPTPASLQAAGDPQRIFVHYRRGDAAGEQAAAALVEHLRARGFRIAEVRPVDLRINQASVRYFFDGDRARSETLEREVDAYVRNVGLAPRSDLLPMRYYEPKPRPGTLEVWLPSGR